ncbi:MAG: hypothetical protein ABI680_06830, partial [Chthoniobacteraceae bacterium]
TETFPEMQWAERAARRDRGDYRQPDDTRIRPDNPIALRTNLREKIRGCVGIYNVPPFQP